uniref:Uncharacterized protein n=1 Tax=Anguilla anguilla TaxID=7936 RepID=A0A0E9Q586_ANGAN
MRRRKRRRRMSLSEQFHLNDTEQTSFLMML